MVEARSSDTSQILYSFSRRSRLCYARFSSAFRFSTFLLAAASSCCFTANFLLSTDTFASASFSDYFFGLTFLLTQ